MLPKSQDDNESSVKEKNEDLQPALAHNVLKMEYIIQ